MPEQTGSAGLARAGTWSLAVAAAAGVLWLAWYGYEERRATTRGLQVIGLLRDVQTCVSLSYEAAGPRNTFTGRDFASVPQMKATPYAGRLEWNPALLRATASFAQVHRDYDGRTLWTAARVGPDGVLRWSCGSDLDPDARSYQNIAQFIEYCDRPLTIDLGVVEYCRKFVPLPSR